MTHTQGKLKVFNGTDIFTDHDGAKDGFHIADCNVHVGLNEDYPNMALAVQQANAERLALCWNAHDGLKAQNKAMLEALEAAAPVLKALTIHTHPGDGPSAISLQVEAIIKAARP